VPLGIKYFIREIKKSTKWDDINENLSCHNSSDVALQEGRHPFQEGVMGPQNKGTHHKRVIQPTYQVLTRSAFTIPSNTIKE
jgi:hypothetical protein